MNEQAIEPLNFEITHGTREGVTIIKVREPLTIRNFFDFQQATRDDKSPVLLIDLADVPYMDSAALGCIVGVHLSCGKHGRKYALVNVNDRLLTMFTVCGVREVLVAFPDLATAETALA